MLAIDTQVNRFASIGRRYWLRSGLNDCMVVAFSVREQEAVSSQTGDTLRSVTSHPREPACRRKSPGSTATGSARGCHFESLSEFEIWGNCRDSRRPHIDSEVSFVYGIREIASNLRVR